MKLVSMVMIGQRVCSVVLIAGELAGDFKVCIVCHLKA